MYHFLFHILTKPNCIIWQLGAFRVPMEQTFLCLQISSFNTAFHNLQYHFCVLQVMKSRVVGALTSISPTVTSFPFSFNSVICIQAACFTVCMHACTWQFVYYSFCVTLLSLMTGGDYIINTVTSSILWHHQCCDIIKHASAWRWPHKHTVHQCYSRMWFHRHE